MIAKVNNVTNCTCHTSMDMTYLLPDCSNPYVRPTIFYNFYPQLLLTQCFQCRGHPLHQCGFELSDIQAQ